MCECIMMTVHSTIASRASLARPIFTLLFFVLCKVQFHNHQSLIKMTLYRKLIMSLFAQKFVELLIL